MTDEAATDKHPSFGLAYFSRVRAMPGASLFDSEILHNSYVTFRVHHAVRDRKLNHDWLHHDHDAPPPIEIAMSMAQFGALVSSFGEGGGVPVTITALGGQPVASPPYQPRTGESLKEVGTATAKAFGGMKKAVSDLRAAFKAGAGRKEMEARIRDIELTYESAAPNAVYVAKSFTEHVENVVTKARADVEAMAHFATSRGIESGADVTLMLPSSDTSASAASPSTGLWPATKGSGT